MSGSLSNAACQVSDPCFPVGILELKWEKNGDFIYSTFIIKSKI